MLSSFMLVMVEASRRRGKLRPDEDVEAEEEDREVERSRQEDEDHQGGGSIWGEEFGSTTKGGGGQR